MAILKGANPDSLTLTEIQKRLANDGYSASKPVVYDSIQAAIQRGEPIEHRHYGPYRWGFST